MKESDLTPEFIAEKILGWEFIPNYNWPMSDLISDCWIQHANDKNIIPYFYTKESLPTFKEPEWTGPLLEIADSIGANELYFSRIRKYENRPCYHMDFYLSEMEFYGPKSLKRNCAIILAICEAKGL